MVDWKQAKVQVQTKFDGVLGPLLGRFWGNKQRILSGTCITDPSDSVNYRLCLFQDRTVLAADSNEVRASDSRARTAKTKNRCEL